MTARQFGKFILVVTINLIVWAIIGLGLCALHDAFLQ